MKRIWHPWHAWECVGMFTNASPYGADESKARYAEFFRDLPKFSATVDRVLRDWPISCEHFLTNDEINRIAWLGQSSMFLSESVPAQYRAGFKLLSADERRAANAVAAAGLVKWQRGFVDHARANRSVHQHLEAAWLPF